VDFSSQPSNRPDNKTLFRSIARQDLVFTTHALLFGGTYLLNQTGLFDAHISTFRVPAQKTCFSAAPFEAARRRSFRVLSSDKPRRESNDRRGDDGLFLVIRAIDSVE
jgi:hypothetical protein